MCSVELVDIEIALISEDDLAPLHVVVIAVGIFEPLFLLELVEEGLCGSHSPAISQNATSFAKGGDRDEDTPLSQPLKEARVGVP